MRGIHNLWPDNGQTDGVPPANPLKSQSKDNKKHDLHACPCLANKCVCVFVFAVVFGVYASVVIYVCLCLSANVRSSSLLCSYKQWWCCLFTTVTFTFVCFCFCGCFRYTCHNLFAVSSVRWLFLSADDRWAIYSRISLSFFF